MEINPDELMKMQDGAHVIGKKWLHLTARERVLIVTTDTHMYEAQVLKDMFSRKTKHVDLMVLEDKGKSIGMYFDEHETIFDAYGTIVGATDYSLVTTRAVKHAIGSGSKFLSLPLSTNNGKSMLGFSFIKMDTKKSKLMANVIKKYVDRATVIQIKTELGTDIKFYKRGRNAGFFNGDIRDGNGFSSASIEVYVPIEETGTDGTVILDGSLGYIGKISKPFRVKFQGGRICEIENCKDGNRLKDYLASFQDFEMYVAAELGIGLNSHSKCQGNCYIEDESAYGTFHIGLGRNIALGGIHEASGHFDIVIRSPDIYADNRKIMERGTIIIPEPQVY